MPTKNQVIETIVHDSWWNFVKNVKPSEGKLFRGHANHEGKDWVVESNFHRAFPNSRFFELDYSHSQWSKYIELYKKENLLLGGLKGNTLLEVLQFFQHYGAPTPLIDFTRNPDTALYFALTGVHHHGVKGDLSNRHVTIVEIDLGTLVNDFEILELNDNNIDFDGIEKQHTIPYLSLTTAFLMPDPSICDNENLRRQEGAFLYLDSSLSLEDVCFDYLVYADRRERGVPIKYHKIPFRSFMDRLEGKPNLYCYLMRKEKLGFNLFNDIQGAKYDYNVPDIQSALSCINNKDCQCTALLLSEGVLD